MDFKTSYNPLSRTWSGKETPRDFDPKISVGQHILNALSKDPEHITQVNISVFINNTSSFLQNTRSAALSSRNFVARLSFVKSFLEKRCLAK